MQRERLKVERGDRRRIATNQEEKEQRGPKSESKMQKQTREMNELHENSYDNVAATGNLEQSGNQTKKRKVQEDDDEEEKHENSHEGDVDSSPIHKKKAEVVWSRELHHKFVLAVNQLIISDAVRHGHPNIVQAMPISKWCSNQFPDSRTDIHFHGVCSTCILCNLFQSPA
ncbi:hypothetical protein RIF29_19045 [Crotalaria pallida]|uniref:Uncharacterized protein n=1 Tax=Crotalaria pallida TaxID=3830 RepID=A0AAN9F1B3_CROPI